MDKLIVGQKAKPVGVPPAIALINPKYPRNVGSAIRMASCFGVNQVWYTGNRVKLEVEKGERLPREERMKGYSKVQLIQYDYFFDQFKNVVPIAVEVRPNSENLSTFEHPENSLYVFGPEDGSIPQVILRHCHRFLVIESDHCLNLANAVAVVLYDRRSKRIRQGLEIPKVPGEVENRGWSEFEDKTGDDYKVNRQYTIEELLK